MDTSNQFAIFPVGGVTPPKGLNAVMQGLVREVLMKNPKDIFSFAAEYFEKLMEIRRSASSDESKEITNIVYLHQSYSDKGKIEGIHPNDELPPMTSGENLVVECLENRKDSRGEISVDSLKEKFDFKEEQATDVNKINSMNEQTAIECDNMDIKISENSSYEGDKEINNRLTGDLDNKDDLVEALENFDSHLLEDHENNHVIEKLSEKDEHEEPTIIDNSASIMQNNKVESIDNQDLPDITSALSLDSNTILGLDKIEQNVNSRNEENDKAVPTDSVTDSEEKDNNQDNALSKEITCEIDKKSEDAEDEKIADTDSALNSQISQTIESNESNILRGESSSDTPINSNVETVATLNNGNVSMDKNTYSLDRDSISNSICGSENQEIQNNEKNVDENLSQTETIAADYDLRTKLEDLDEINIDEPQKNNSEIQNETNEEKERKFKESTNKEEQKDIFEKASIVIQKIYRGFIARNKVSQMKKNKKNEKSEEWEEEKNDALENFTEPITQIIRANVEPILYTVPEEKNGSYSTEDESSTFSSAATKIQAGVRGFLTRKYFQQNKNNTSSDTTAPSIGDDSKSLEEIISTFESNSGEDPVSQIIVATSSILIEQLEHFEKLESSQFQSTMSNVDSLEMSREGDDSKRKRLKREDAIQLHSPYSSGETSVNKYTPNKLSEDEEPIGDLAQSIISEIISSSYAKLEKISQAAEESDISGDMIDDEQCDIAKNNADNILENVENTNLKPDVEDIKNETIQDECIVEKEHGSTVEEINFSNDEKQSLHSEKKLISHESFQSDDGDVVTGSIKSIRLSSNIDDYDNIEQTEEQKDKISLNTISNENFEQKEEASFNIDDNSEQNDSKKETASNGIIENDNTEQKEDEQGEDSIPTVVEANTEPKEEAAIDIIENNSTEQKEKQNEEDSIPTVDEANTEPKEEALIDIIENNSTEQKEEVFIDDNQINEENKIESAELLDESPKPMAENELLQDGKSVSLDPTDDLLTSNDTLENINDKEDKHKGILHSGEFHDALLPTKVNRRPTSAEKDLKIV